MTKSREFFLCPHFKSKYLFMYLRYIFSIHLFDKLGYDAMGYTEHEYTMFAALESLLIYDKIFL